MAEAYPPVSTVPTASGFAAISNEDIDSFIDSNKSKRTKANTNVALLYQFLQRRDERRLLQDLPPNELNDYLSMFFLAVLKQYGTE